MEIKAEPCETETPAAPSFFKIMFGNLFPTTLLIPPAFANNFYLLFPQEFVLTSAQSGRRWHVTVRKVENKLYFGKGWSTFVQDKGIILGDFLVFSYVAKLEFNVKIFRKNGCQEATCDCEEEDAVTGNELQVMHSDNVEIVQSYQDQHSKFDDGEGNSVVLPSILSSKSF